MALAQLIFLPLEGEEPADWERKELDELEREFRRNPPWSFRRTAAGRPQRPCGQFQDH